MTMLIGAHLRQYTLLTADTRVVWPHPFHYKDGESKIALGRTLAVTGAGHAPTLKQVKSALVSSDERSPEKILATVKFQFPRTAGSRCCILLTYLPRGPQTASPRLEMFCSGPPFQVYRDESPCIVIPPDMPPRQGEVLREVLQRSLREMGPGERWLDTLPHNFKVIAACHHYASERSITISRDIDIVILHGSGKFFSARGPIERFCPSDQVDGILRNYLK